MYVINIACNTSKLPHFISTYQRNILVHPNGFNYFTNNYNYSPYNKPSPFQFIHNSPLAKLIPNVANWIQYFLEQSIGYNTFKSYK